MQDKIKEIEFEIRNVISDSRRPSQGCEVAIICPTMWGKAFPVSKGVIVSVEEDFSDDDGDVQHRLLYNVCNTETLKVGKYEFNWLEIIGHPVTLTHMLKWLNNVLKEDSFGKCCDFYISDEGNLIRRNDNDSYDFIAELDLDKPLISDQSEELINFLYDIIEIT